MSDDFLKIKLRRVIRRYQWLAFWRKLAGGSADASCLPPFVPRQWIEPLAELEAGWCAATAGESVLHNDLRADNVLIDVDGTAAICDWNWATLGPSWFDLTVLLADAGTDGHDVSTLLARHPAATGADPEQVDSALETLLIPSAGNAELKSLLETGLKIFQGHEMHAEHVASELK